MTDLGRENSSSEMGTVMHFNEIVRTCCWLERMRAVDDMSQAPHPADAINRVPTHSPSLRSAFLPCPAYFVKMHYLSPRQGCPAPTLACLPLVLTSGQHSPSTLSWDGMID